MDTHVLKLDSTLIDRDAALAQRDAAINERDIALAKVDFLQNTRSWRFTRPLRSLFRLMRYGFSATQEFPRRPLQSSIRPHHSRCRTLTSPRISPRKGAWIFSASPTLSGLHASSDRSS